MKKPTKKDKLITEAMLGILSKLTKTSARPSCGVPWRSSCAGRSLFAHAVPRLPIFSCRLTGSDVGFRNLSSRFRHKSGNARMVLKLKLDSELKTSGLRGPAGRSPARPPISPSIPVLGGTGLVVALGIFIVSTLVSLVGGVGLPRRYQVLRLRLRASQGLV